MLTGYAKSAREALNCDITEVRFYVVKGGLYAHVLGKTDLCAMDIVTFHPGKKGWFVDFDFPDDGVLGPLVGNAPLPPA